MSQSPSDLVALKLWCSLIPFKLSISEYQWMLDQICFVVESISVDSRLFVSFFWQGPDHLHPHRDWFAPDVESKTSGSIIPWNHVILLVAIHINHLNHMLQVTRHHALEKQSLYGVPWRCLAGYFRVSKNKALQQRIRDIYQKSIGFLYFVAVTPTLSVSKESKKARPKSNSFFSSSKAPLFLRWNFWVLDHPKNHLQKIASDLIPALPSARPWFWFLRSDARVVGHGHWSPLAALTSRGGRQASSLRFRTFQQISSFVKLL